jgi:hypothetical protein
MLTMQNPGTASNLCPGCWTAPCQCYNNRPAWPVFQPCDHCFCREDSGGYRAHADEPHFGCCMCTTVRAKRLVSDV